VPFIRQTFSSQGIIISTLEWSQGKTPLLCLHGLGDQSLVWSSLGDFLAPSYHILAPDLRGHGESSKPPTGYYFENYLDDLKYLMAQREWTSAHIVAHSWAAKLACIWATQEPEKFRSLTLVDPFFIGQIPPIFKLTFPLLYKVLSFFKLSQSFSSYSAMESKARQLPEYQGWSPLQQQVFQASIEEKADGTWSSKFVQQARDEVFEEVMTVAGLTQPVTIPTLLIQPNRGVNRTAWQLKPYQQYLKNLEIQKMVGNHWSFMVNADDFNVRVAHFLERL
jgi:pimeloyl-ACP methyl ester carboxylesterase